jgi:6-phosphofructokinase 1
VLAGDKLGWEVVGFRNGFEGLLPPGNHVNLDRQAVNRIMALGGTILGTTNRGHFVAKSGAGDRTIVPAKIIADASKILEDLRVRALIIVGGDGSLVTAQQLQEVGINCIGVPKTIDNDLEATATTFGFDSAVDVSERGALRINGELSKLPSAPRAQCRSSQSPEACSA